MHATLRIASSIAVAVGLLSAAAPAFAAPVTNSAAHGNNNWNGGGNIGWGNNGWRNVPPQAQVDTINIGIDRYVGNEILPLRQLGGITPQYNGRTLRSVVVEINPWGPAAQLQLLVNGQVVDSGYTNGKQRVELRPGQVNTFGPIQTLQLRAIGFVSIDDIEVNVLRQASYGPGQPGWGPNPWQPQPPQPVCRTIERHLNAQVRFSQLSLNNLFNLSQYQGCRIGSVSFVANTAQGQGQAAVSVNGVEATNRQQVAAHPGLYTLSFWNRPQVGGNAPQVALNLMGLFNVQTVRLNLVPN